MERTCMKVIECEARDIEVGHDLVNVGEVANVHGGDDCVFIETFGPFNRQVGVRPIRGAVYRGTDTLYRFDLSGGE